MWLSQNTPFCVIPAEAGIYNLLIFMDACFRRNDKPRVIFDFILPEMIPNSVILEGSF
jgi:hypothetical protein